MKRKIITAALALAVLLGCALPISAARITHGTANQWIQENMVRNDPPADYTVNQSTQADAKDAKYSAYFPDTELQEVYIEIAENNLNYLLQNATEEPYVMATSVTIGDTTLGYCGLKTKGNYTLSHSYTDNPGSDRFSFTVNFGKYITKAGYGEKQNFYGCEKISFNNFFFDKSMMKEYFAFKLMEEMGLPTPEYCLAKLYINGSYYGVYFMVEALDETILERYFNCTGKEISSYLCKPTQTSFNYGELAKDSAPLYEHDEETLADVSDMLPTVLDWVKKLNQLSSGKDFGGSAIDVQSQEYIELLGSIMELDEVIRYFAVSSWLCQMDNMFTNYQNFGLYVSEAGVATLVPWDYDLSFGCYYPSSSETTANYPLDVMYRLDSGQYSREAEVSERTYKQFPLFYVIYQNDQLMERYHNYMADCSRIAALGGTTEATGKSYDPGWFAGFIDELSQELTAAASEKLASNVYYMNGANQPADVEEALPNLAQIIAQRSVGVWVQVMDLDTKVCGAGCDLATLGNAITGTYSNSGTLTVVDAATGIFATAEYSGGKRSLSPSMTLTALPESDADYQSIRKALGCSRADTLLVYDSYLSVKAKSQYALTIPVAQEYLESGLKFYTWSDGELTELSMTRSGNLFTGTAQDIGTIVILAEKDAGGLWIAVGIAAAVLAAAAAAVVIIRKKKTP